jgi:(5-formylfuran-3-yl)methyl phosphate synthase
MPRLLVSVRNPTEALAAHAGGADLIDVKEPAHGPLGRADHPVIESIIAVVGRAPISAACGELNLDPVLLPAGLTFAKFGLAGWKNRDWVAALERVRGTLPPGCGLVAVAYADWRSCNAPPPDEIAEAAIAHGYAAFLIDTHDKDGRTLLHHFSVAEINALTDRCRSADVPVALAGSLGLAEIDRLHEVNPDWFAVRGAACEGGRGGTISSRRVRQLKEALPSQTRVAANQCLNHLAT